MIDVVGHINYKALILLKNRLGKKQKQTNCKALSLQRRCERSEKSSVGPLIIWASNREYNGFKACLWKSHNYFDREEKNQAEASSGSISDHFKRQMIIGLLVISSHTVWLICELIFQSEKKKKRGKLYHLDPNVDKQISIHWEFRQDPLIINSSFLVNFMFSGFNKLLSDLAGYLKTRKSLQSPCFIFFSVCLVCLFSSGTHINVFQGKNHWLGYIDSTGFLVDWGSDDIWVYGHGEVVAARLAAQFDCRILGAQELAQVFIQSKHQLGNTCTLKKWKQHERG